MPHPLLFRLLQVALELTETERGMALDPEMQVIGLHNLTHTEIESPAFMGFVNVQQAVQAQQTPYLTNNLILDIHSAPNTNTNLANMRFVLIFSFGGYGYLYVDQALRKGGNFEKTLIDGFQAQAQAWLDANTDLPPEQMLAILRQA